MGTLSDALFLGRKDLAYMLRAKETLLWTFAMPILFFYFIGTVTGGFGGGGDGQETVAVSGADEAGFLADHFLERVEERGFTVLRAEDGTEFVAYNRRLLLPEGMTGSVQAREPARIEFLRARGGTSAQFDEIRLSRALYSLLADLIVTEEEGGRLSAEALEEMRARPRAVTLQVSAAGVRPDPPNGFEQAVPGTMVMFTLLVLFTSGSVLLVVDRNQGLLRRLASAPVSRGAVVLGKWGARLVLGMVQIGFAMLAGTLFFGVDWGGHLAAVFLVLGVYAALAACLALLAGNLARSEGQAIAAGVIASNVLAALGGCWWPIEITPAWAQKLALFLPTGWAMDALHKLVSFGQGPAAVLPHVAVMAAAALLVGWLVARTFRFE